MVSRQDKHEYLNRDDYFDCIDRTSASIEAENEEERLNKKNQLKLVPKKEEEIKLEEDDDLKIKCEPDIGEDSERYYKCS